MHLGLNKNYYRELCDFVDTALKIYSRATYHKTHVGTINSNIEKSFKFVEYCLIAFLLIYIYIPNYKIFDKLIDI